MITAPIRALVLDIDGVLSPPCLLMGENGATAKLFSVRDGLGIELLKQHGITVLLLTSRADPANLKRAQELGIEILVSPEGKAKSLANWLREKQISPREVVYLGDDLVDIEALKSVGWPVAVRDATPPVKGVVRRVTRAPGGLGAVREVCDWILFRVTPKFRG